MRVFSLAIGIGVGLVVCAAGGTLVFQNTGATEITLNQSPLKDPNFPENMNGQSYGTAEESTPVEMLPDLIHVGSVNGIAGYLSKKDYLSELGRDVPLYDVDGTTIIGSFYIHTKNMNYPNNNKGQTYGSAADASSPETEPDLIKAYGLDGTEGYVRKTDLDGKQPKNPEEAAELMRTAPPFRIIPLYDVDGTTVIGQFKIG